MALLGVILGCGGGCLWAGLKGGCWRGVRCEMFWCGKRREVQRRIGTGEDNERRSVGRGTISRRTGPASHRARGSSNCAYIGTGSLGIPRTPILASGTASGSDNMLRKAVPQAVGCRGRGREVHQTDGSAYLHRPRPIGKSRERQSLLPGPHPAFFENTGHGRAVGCGWGPEELHGCRM